MIFPRRITFWTKRKQTPRSTRSISYTRIKFHNERSRVLLSFRKDKGIRFFDNQDPSVLASPKGQPPVCSANGGSFNRPSRRVPWVHVRARAHIHATIRVYVRVTSDGYPDSRTQPSSTVDWHSLSVAMGWVLVTVRWRGVDRKKKMEQEMEWKRRTISINTLLFCY